LEEIAEKLAEKADQKRDENDKNDKLYEPLQSLKENRHFHDVR